MKANDIRERTTEELRELEKELSKKLWKARFDNHTNQLDDTSEIPKIRRDIARVKTILVERAKQTASASE
ncbi:MAG: 50S ribosomal protein L29 [Sandaracinus sp.]|nr:50S ribosomal protein L29 [Myxococcales bacterium]MCB9631733.1 50S ribosomal protein L29 [Sandaracinus sp.]